MLTDPATNDQRFRVRLSRLMIVSCSVITLVLLTACGSASTATKTTTTTTATPGNTLDAITVGDADAVPTATFKTTPLKVTVTTTKVITAGKGAILSKANVVNLNYVLFNGKDGKQMDTTLASGTVGMELGSATLFPGLRKSLIGRRIGSRLLVAIPPVDAYGVEGKAELGFGPTDTLVYLMDLVSAGVPLTSASGAEVPPVSGLPTALVDGADPARITVPKTAAPTKLVVQPLIKGAGEVVRAGQRIKITYTGVLWRNGARISASADTGGPKKTVIGRGNVIPAWDKSLVGQTVGSRILLVVPPVDGFGAKGLPPEINGTDTLVFVIDILAVV